MALPITKSWKNLHPHLSWILESKHLLIIGIISSVIALFISLNDFFWKRTIISLEKHLTKAQGNNDLIAENIRHLFDGYLFHLSNKLGYGNSQKKSERITLYIHNNEGKSFIPFGRFSHNATLAKPGRTEYPEDEGCIGEAWQHGWCFDNKFSKNDKQRTKKHSQKYKLNNKAINKMNMKSQAYAACRITDKKGLSVAVIVIESTESNNLNEVEIQQFLENQLDYLCELIVQLKRYIPQPSKAKTRGF